MWLRPHGERFAFSGLNLRRCGYASHRIFQKGRIKMRKSRVQRIWENAVVFYFGGMFYCTVELLWRQWTHGSMFLLGGLCFWTVSSLGRRVRMPLLAQMALGACIVTFFEFWRARQPRDAPWRVGLFRRAVQSARADLPAVHAPVVPIVRHRYPARPRHAPRPVRHSGPAAAVGVGDPKNARHGRLTVTGALRISAFAVFLHSSSEHNTLF